MISLNKKEQSSFASFDKQLLTKASAAAVMGITLGLVFVNLAWWINVAPEPAVYAGHPVLLRFSSYSELKMYLNETSDRLQYYYWNARGGLPSAVTFSEFKSASVDIDFSKTNIQVEGVDEADIVKCDGEYIYLALNERNGKVLIVKAYPPEDAQVVAEIKLNGTIVGLFINKDRLIVFETEYQESPITLPGKNPIYRSQFATIRIYDVTKKANPVLKRTVSSDGWYFAARMIGDYVYLVVNQPAYLREGEVSLPVIIDDGQTKEVPATSIYYVNATDYSYGFTTIVAVNVYDGEEKPAHETFLLGANRGIYVSLSNIYLAIPRYDPDAGVEKTEVYRLRIQGSNITCEASGQVSGYILNQFSMDEYAGYFRIATTTGHVARQLGQSSSSNNVYVLDMNMTLVGKIEGLAPNERIYSARFMGSRCYLVTFKKVDPLFVISLEDPAKPTVLGKLKIPGYSDYLHLYSENLLIGIGKETVEAEEGDFTWYQGVKISLFDVSDVEHPKEVAKYIIGDRGTDSPVLRDHKALLFDKKRHLLALPVLVAEIDEAKYPKGVPANAYGDYVWQGLYIFNVTDKAITFKGRVTHLENSSDLSKSGYYFRSQYEVKRSLYIEDWLYTISDKKIKINNLSTLEPFSEVELP